MLNVSETLNPRVSVHPYRDPMYFDNSIRGSVRHSEACSQYAVKCFFVRTYGAYLVVIASFVSVGFVGCGGQADDAASQTSANSDTSSKDDEPDSSDPEGSDPKITPKTLITERSFGDGGGSTSSRRASLGVSQAIDRIGLALTESLELGPVRVVWLFDATTNADGFNAPLRDKLVQLYRDFEDDTPRNSLTTEVAVFGDEVEFLQDRGTEDLAAAAESLQSISFDRGDRQNTFAALSAAIDRQVGADGNQQVFLVCLTNEAGDDRENVATAAESLRTSQIPLYVIGLPAPFGRVGNETSRSMMRQNSNPQNGLIVGPESCVVERIQMAYPTSAEQTFWLDSGFGSWGLEYLARLNGGRYLIVRDTNSGFSGGLTGGEWPRRSARRFAEDVMSKYRPDYSSEEECLAAIGQSAMRKALVDAAKLPAAQVLTSTTLEFDARDRTRLVNQITQAQREPARVLPRIEALKLTLQQGEADRANEKDPRWQAAFDLAMGRALAAYSRADGYNTLLADLKQGRSFEVDGSDSWILEPTKTFEEGGTSLRGSSEKAVEYLERVIAEHPGTPWAFLAEQELSQSVGWKIVESDRYEDD